MLINNFHKGKYKINGYAMCFYKKVFILKLYEYFYIDSTMFLERGLNFQKVSHYFWKFLP